MQTLLDKEEMAAKTRKDKQLQLIELLQDRAIELASNERFSGSTSEPILNLAKAIQCLVETSQDVGRI